MGYELHITRNPDWVDDGPAIPQSEWDAYVRSDPDMRVIGSIEAHSPDGSIIRYEGDNLSVWKSPTDEVLFYYYDGAIAVKYPDAPTIGKMLEIASKLDAKVVGDDGEMYPLDSSELPASTGAVPDEKPVLLKHIESFTKLPFPRQLLIAFFLGCVLLGLKLLVFGQ